MNKPSEEVIIAMAFLGFEFFTLDYWHEPNEWQVENKERIEAISLENVGRYLANFKTNEVFYLDEDDFDFNWNWFMEAYKKLINLDITTVPFELLHRESDIYMPLMAADFNECLKHLCTCIKIYNNHVEDQDQTIEA